MSQSTGLLYRDLASASLKRLLEARVTPPPLRTSLFTTSFSLEITSINLSIATIRRLISFSSWQTGVIMWKPICHSGEQTPLDQTSSVADHNQTSPTIADRPFSLSLSPFRIFSNAAKIISTHQRRGPGPSPPLKRGPDGPFGLRVHNNHFWDVYFQMLKPTINFLSGSSLEQKFRKSELWNPKNKQIVWSD